MKRHPNAQLILDYLDDVNQYLKAVENGTAPPGGYKNKYLADDVVAQYQGRNDLAGRHGGEAFYKKYVPRLSAYKSTLVEVIDVLASDHRGAAIVRERMESSDGRSIEFVRVAIYLIADGRIKEMWSLDEDQYAMDEFLMAGRNPAG